MALYYGRPHHNQLHVEMYFTYIHQYESDPFNPKTIAAWDKVISVISQELQSTWQTTVGGTIKARNSRKAWTLKLLLNGKTPHSVLQLEPNLKTDDFNHFTKPFSLQELNMLHQYSQER